MRKGVPVSPGIAVGRAYCVDAVLARREPQHLDAAALSDEVSRFDMACTEAARELDAIVQRVSKQVGEEEAAIFRGHRLLLRDPALIGKVKNTILTRHVNARTALHEALDEYSCDQRVDYFDSAGARDRAPLASVPTIGHRMEIEMPS